MNKKMPVMFIGHGSPMVAVEEDAYTVALDNAAKTLPKPEAIVVVSAHWEAPHPIRVMARKNSPIIYDFYGFPSELYNLTYPSPGDPVIAKQIVGLLSKAGHSVQLDFERGLDHGAWIPLLRLYPEASIPVVQVTLPVPRAPEGLVHMGKTLEALRTDGILLMGSGNLIHNLRIAHFDDKYAPVDPWARELDDWLIQQFKQMEIQKFLTYRKNAPHAALGAPTTEHVDPLFFVLGAALGEPMTTLFDGFHYGNLSMRTFILGQ